MGTLNVEYVPLSQIKPYAGNVKIHTPKQVEQIIKSIREFGFVDPIGVWRGEIVEGHGRYEAAKKMGLDTVPIIRLDSLTEEQRKAYTLIHNQLTMNTGFELEELQKELVKIESIDMGAFDFSLPEIQIESAKLALAHEKAKQDTQWMRANIQNLATAQFDGIGKYDIPQIQPVYSLPKIREWISFNYVMSDKEPEGKAVHFFLDDYQFERVWNQPEAYIEKLRQYVCVASPDFSPYSDMPFCLQIYNHYRKHWCAAYWQRNGITVIPTIRASEDERYRDVWLEGEPEGGIVLVSTMWASAHFNSEKAKRNRDEIIRRLHPSKWYVYGKAHHDLFDGMDAEFIKAFGEQRWGK